MYVDYLIHSLYKLPKLSTLISHIFLNLPGYTLRTERTTNSCAYEKEHTLADTKNTRLYTN